MKKLLLSCMMLLGIGGSLLHVSAAKTIGTEYTKVEDLSGKIFAIVNKAEEKAICNKKASNDFDLQFLPYADAFSSSVTAYLFKIEQVNDPDDAAANGKYTIRAVKEDGSNYTLWGWAAPYFQSNITGSGVCFFFAFNGHKRGADADNTGTWDLQYDAVKGGWTLLNVGTGKYYNDPTKDAMSDTPAYFTFCDVVEAATSLTVNYKLYYGGGLVATSGEVGANPGDAAVVPEELRNSFCTYSYSPATITENGDITVTVTWNGPIAIAADYASINWKNLYLNRSKKWYLNNGESPCLVGDPTDNERAADSYQWGLVGNPYSYKIYNKAAGSTKNLNGSAAMADGEYSWTKMAKNGDGILFGRSDGQYLNQAGGDGNTGLGFWGDNKDAGSTFFVANVPDVEPIVSVDRWLVYSGEAKANPWDKQAHYNLPTIMEVGKTYVVKADLKSANGGDCALWPIDTNSDNKDEWGGSKDLLYLASYNTTTSLTTYTWEFKATFPMNRLQFVFGKLDGKLYIDNVSCKEKGSDVEMVVNGDFSTNSTTGWSLAGSTSFSLEVVPSDPLIDIKDALQALIDKAGMYNAYAYTTGSFEDLTGMISAAETALNAGDATESSLTTAKTNLQNAIDGLELKEGYENLTEDMVYSWTGWGTEAVRGSNSGNYAYVLFESTGQPYGDPSVNAWAELTSYEKLVIISTGGTPRFLLNRDADNGQWNEDPSESHLIDNTKGSSSSWHAKYFSHEGNVWIVDLAQMAADKGFARLNAIKSTGGNVTVSGMYLYKAPDPLAGDKEVLAAKIEQAELLNPLGKTTDSFGNLTDAIDLAGDELVSPSATKSSLEAAGELIDEAIAGLKLAAGYAKVTTSMFMTWNGDGADAKATGVSPAGVNNIGVANAGVPYGYGSGNVYWNHYADLTPFTKLYACGTPGKRARYLFNRPMDPENPTGEGTPAFVQKYVDINSDGVAELTLSEVGEFAHLNTFKAPDAGTLFTDFLVYAAKTNISVGAAGYTTFNSIMNIDLTGVTGYAAKYADGKIKLTEIDAVPAGKAIIVKATEGNYSLTNIESADDIDTDLLVSDGSVNGDGSTIFALANGASGVGFYRVAASVTIPAGKAYMVITGAGAREFVGFGEDEATGIQTVKTAKADQKIFNLNGQRIAQPVKGLNIIGGKKVMK